MKLSEYTIRRRHVAKLCRLAWLWIIIYVALQFQTVRLYHQSYTSNASELEDKTNEVPVSQRLHNGRTIRDLLQRVLSRRIASSNVLVITPTKVTELISRFENGPGQAVYDKAVSENHSVHYLDSGRELDLDHWWRNEHDFTKQNWFLFTFITATPPQNILGKGIYDSSFESEEDLTILPFRQKKKNMSVDKVFRSANTFLSEATLTYLVVEVTITSSHTRNGLKPFAVGGNTLETYYFDGREALQALLQRKYKVQLLASTHLLTDWGPNTLLTDHNIDSFFSAAVDALRLRNDGSLHMYIFATQGLDLAIPSRSESFTHKILLMMQTGGNGLGGFYADKNRDIIPQCPKSCIEVEFRPNEDNLEGQIISLKVNGTSIDDESNKKIETWFSSDDHSIAEAACIKMVESTYDSVSCTSRIIKQTQPELMQQKRNKQAPNILSILIDPISREQFRQKLPRTSQLLKNLNFAIFQRHTVVGGNSGPNQAAIFSGKPLSNGRNGINASSSHGYNKMKQKSKWIWDDLRENGYVTFKAEDGCILNSNMIQSLQPNVTHGSALHEMFCFAFERPNCLGGKLVASYLLNAADQFISAYSGDTPWAAFLSFTDSHEDSMSLIQLLDDLLFDFISKIEVSNTLVIVQSDHGLHYGPYFQSAIGERERSQPVLSLRLPNSLDHYKVNLESNTNSWTSPFDVYETIKDVASISYKDSRSIGSSLTKGLPKERQKCSGAAGVPLEYCDRVESSDTRDLCANIPLPPTPLSFYADISDHDKIKFLVDTSKVKFDKSPMRKRRWKVPMGISCMCATDLLNWYDCKSHPWRQQVKDASTVALMNCVSNDGRVNNVDIDIRLVTRTKVSSTKQNIFSSFSILSDADQIINRSLLCSDSLLSVLNATTNARMKQVYIQLE